MESEAKQFAKTMLPDGMKIMAGTLHPHQPMRRIIGSSEINQWIEGKKVTIQLSKMRRA
jgi:hypothetical protein